MVLDGRIPNAATTANAETLAAISNTVKSSSNYEIAFYEAECFLEVSKLIDRRQIELSVPPTTMKNISKNTNLQFAKHVNHAYAFELYLKCLMIIENGTFYSGHDLLELFKKLNPSTQSSIVDYYKSNYRIARRNMTYFGFFDEPDFFELLGEAKKAFMDFRYLFERNGTPPYELDGIVECVRREIIRLKPELATLW